MFNVKTSKLCGALVVLGVASYAPQAMSFGFGNLMGGSSSASSNAGNPDTFMKTAASAGILMNESLAHLTHALVSKNESAKIDADRKAANAITDPKEKEAALTKVNESETAAINEATHNTDLKAQIKKMDSDKRAELGASAFNFSLALLQDKSLSDQATGLMSSMSSNPMQATKLGDIKGTVSSLSTQISSGSKIAGKMPDIFSAVSVKAPVSSTDKPMTIKESAGI